MAATTGHQGKDELSSALMSVIQREYDGAIQKGTILFLFSRSKIYKA